MIKDNLVFLREFISEFQATGSFLPSSKWAADQLTHPIRNGRMQRLNILEVGPGSGPVTVRILKHMREHDTLTVCELNPRFMKALKEKLSKNEDYLVHKERVYFFEGAIQDYTVQSHTPQEKFDVIICAIPFLNLEAAMVEEIFEKLKSLSSDQGLMTYFEYMGIRPMSLVISPPDRKRRIRELDMFFKRIFGKHCLDKRRVWLNVPPINIYTLNLAA